MVKCVICGEEFNQITHKHLIHHDMTVDDYKKQFPDSPIISDELSDKLSNRPKMLGDKNPAKRPEIRKKISDTVKSKWQDGAYIKRINGMLGKFKELSPVFKEGIWEPNEVAERYYREFLAQFQDIEICNMCGEKAINIHHIDEQRFNFLPSNLEPLCRPCHTSIHYEFQKRPFEIIAKQMVFDAAHMLPNHPGKCRNWHGHQWKVEVAIMKRVNPKTGMVTDFGTLKKIMQEHIVDVFDHGVVNDNLELPTAENLLQFVWEKLMFDALLKGIFRIRIWETPESSAELNIYGMLSLFSNTIDKHVSRDFINYLQERGKKNE